MANLSDLTTFKVWLMQQILSDQTCVDLITDTTDTPVPAASLLYKKVFPYDWVDETLETAGTYICCELDPTDVVSPSVRNYTLTIWIIVSKELMRLDDGTGLRRDKLADRIDQLVNGKTQAGGSKVIGKIEPLPSARITYVGGFKGRVLKYKLSGVNLTGGHLWPSGK